MRRLMLILLFLGALLQASCGFRLRGEISLPPELQSLRVQVADPFSPLQRNLEQALARAGAREPVGKERAALLRIGSNRITRMPLSVGRTGRVQEYSMRYEVRMELSMPLAGSWCPSRRSRWSAATSSRRCAPRARPARRRWCAPSWNAT